MLGAKPGNNPASYPVPSCHWRWYRGPSYRVPWCLVAAGVGSQYPPGQQVPQETGRGRVVPPARGSSARAFEQELREESHADRRRPLGMAGALALEIRGSRDVQMHPRKAVDELTQEPGACDRAGGATTGILHVGDI